MGSERYRAFISYSHQDEAFARWLHRQLEAWRVPRDLVGRRTPVGEVPRSLRPIFRDRDDFAGGASLRQATREALAVSEFLIVLCSPASANSGYVDEEVRQFKALGRGDRIIPVILSGEPGDAARECFPAAVRQRLDERGQPTGETEEPLAADAREIGDGRQRALAKVVAGLLGLAFDEITRRAERDRRRRAALLAGFATGAVAFATVFGSYALHQSHQARLAIDRSLFALGSIIQRVDALDPAGDAASLRAEMLMTQCDIAEGLAGDRRSLQPDTEARCTAERARVLGERGEHSEAIALAEALLPRLRGEFDAATDPGEALAAALVRTSAEAYRRRAAAEDPATESALAAWVADALRVRQRLPGHPDSHAAFNEAVQAQVDYLSARLRWSELDAALGDAIAADTALVESGRGDQAAWGQELRAQRLLARALNALEATRQMQDAAAHVDLGLADIEARLAEAQPWEVPDLELLRLEALRLQVRVLAGQQRPIEAEAARGALAARAAELLQRADLSQAQRGAVEEIRGWALAPAAREGG